MSPSVVLLSTRSGSPRSGGMPGSCGPWRPRCQKLSVCPSWRAFNPARRGRSEGPRCSLQEGHGLNPSLGARHRPPRVRSNLYLALYSSATSDGVLMLPHVPSAHSFSAGKCSRTQARACCTALWHTAHTARHLRLPATSLPRPPSRDLALATSFSRPPSCDLRATSLSRPPSHDLRRTTSVLRPSSCNLPPATSLLRPLSRDLPPVTSE